MREEIAARPREGSLPRLLVVTASAELYGSDRSLINALPQLSHSFDITIAFPAMGPAVDLALQHGAQAIITPDFAVRRRNLQSPTRLFAWFRRIRSAHRQLDREHHIQPFAMIYSNTFAAGIGPMLKRSWKVPHILHVRECPLDPRWQIATLCRNADRSSELIICNSQYTKGLLTQVRPSLAVKTRIVHNGIEMPPESSIVTPRREGPLRISCVGRIHPKKGQSILLEAAAIARRDGRNWALHFFGDALPEHQDLFTALKAQVENSDLTSQVTWHGFVDGDARYAGCDVAVVPSVYPEEFSLVCAEAQAMGLPVVATGPGGPSEILTDNETGYIIPPCDGGALYRALSLLDDNRELAIRFGTAGSTRVRATFSREAYGEALSDTLQSVLALRR
jgi:glycosyltransferase involved in cell wall biosynthesis